MLRIGHRGARGHAPENTLKAIEAGIRAGADLVELDIQRTADGALVVMHDKRVDRTTNGTGCVTRMSLEELRRLDAGEGERIPTLEEVLTCANGRTGLMLEIITPGIGAQLSRMVQQAGFAGPVVYASFLHAELSTAPEPRLALLDGIPVRGAGFARDAQASHVGVSIDCLTPDFAAALREAGLRIFVYTVNDPRDIAWLKSLQVDGIISDYPERVPK